MYCFTRSQVLSYNVSKQIDYHIGTGEDSIEEVNTGNLKINKQTDLKEIDLDIVMSK